MEAHLAQLRAQMARTDEIKSCLRSLSIDATDEERAILQRCMYRMDRVEHTLCVLRDALSEHLEAVSAYKQQLSHELDELQWDIRMLF